MILKKIVYGFSLLAVIILLSDAYLNAQNRDFNLRNNAYYPGGTDVAIADGGTGQSTKTEAFDALAPPTTTGDTIYYNGTDNVRLAIGAAGTALKGGTTPSWGYQVANASTVDLGWLLLPTVFFAPTNASTLVEFVGVANQVRVHQFVLPFRITVSDIRVRVEAIEAGKACAFAIYRDTVSAPVLETGAMSVAAAAVVTADLATDVVLEPDVYYFAWTSTSTIATARGLSSSSNYQSLWDDTVAQAGNATNASVASVFPATLGTVTYANNTIPFALMKP